MPGASSGALPTSGALPDAASAADALESAAPAAESAEASPAAGVEAPLLDVSDDGGWAAMMEIWGESGRERDLRDTQAAWQEGDPDPLVTLELQLAVLNEESQRWSREDRARRAALYSEHPDTTDLPDSRRRRASSEPPTWVLVDLAWTRTVDFDSTTLRLFPKHPQRARLAGHCHARRRRG